LLFNTLDLLTKLVPGNERHGHWEDSHVFAAKEERRIVLLTLPPEEDADEGGHLVAKVLVKGPI